MLSGEAVMSIIESLKKLVDPVAVREQEAELRRVREQPRREAAGPPPAFACRVCGYLGPDPAYCPQCLAQTMGPADPKLSTRAAPNDAVAGEPLEIPVDGNLDLHTFRPSEVKSLLPEYLQACADRGIRQVRIVHGKGTGALRKSVHALLARSPLVLSFRTGDEAAGAWGATLVILRA
jgi:hypothetical protein